MLNRSTLIAPESVLENENESHDETGCNANPSRKHISLNQVRSDLVQATIDWLRANRLGEPEECRDAGARANILGL